MDEKAAILHVEDDEVDVENLIRAFERCRIPNPVVSVADGEEALELLRSQESQLRPGLVLLDLSMPRMGGLHFLRQRTESSPELRRIPVVVLTASNEEADRRRAYELGAAGYVVKPIDPDAYLSAVDLIQRYWTLCESA